jgi:hypothetical protein
MPRRSDKPTTFKTWVQQRIPGATSPEMKDALAKAVSPEMKGAFAEMARRLQQPFQGEQDPPAAAPEAPTSKPSSEPSPSLEPSTQETLSPEVSAPKTSTPETSTPDLASSEVPEPPPPPVVPMPEVSTLAEALTSEPSTSEASTTSAAPAPLPTRWPRRGEQEKRAERILRRNYPGGKTPVSLSAARGAAQINKGLAAEKRDHKAPTDEVGLPDVSPDTAGRTMNKLGRT